MLARNLDNTGRGRPDSTILRAVLTGAYVAIANEEFAGMSGVSIPKAQNHFLE